MAMTAKRFVLCFVAAGIALPVAWLSVYRIYPAGINWVTSVPRADGLLLMLWPSSILLLGDPNDTSMVIPIVSVALNVVLYGILGGLLWLGLKRSKVVLAATVAAVSLGWYGLLTLYY